MQKNTDGKRGENAGAERRQLPPQPKPETTEIPKKYLTAETKGAPVGPQAPPTLLRSAYRKALHEAAPPPNGLPGQTATPRITS